MRLAVSTWQATRPARDWQDRFFETYGMLEQQDFLLVATPGAGKTFAILQVLHDLLVRGIVERVVIVVPTNHLRQQWADDADEVGLQLDPTFENQHGLEIGEDFHGVVVTYQAVASAPAVYATQCRKYRTAAVLDEVHHLGDQLAWGGSAREAFAPATRRIADSGTAFRGDNRPMPFIRYAENQSVADFTYSYSAALAQGVCRYVIFPEFEGVMAWAVDGDRREHAFVDALSADEAARRLRTALDLRGTWLPAVLREADLQLSITRQQQHPHAGGLVVAIDIEHARGIGRLLEEMTGVAPLVIVSDDPFASRKIKLFKDSGERWAVAVRMVSEGVDIPRLRVGVYATNIITELYFRQFVGRFVRSTPAVPDDVAKILLPADAVLCSYAERIKQEIAHTIEQLLLPPDDGDRDGDGDGEGRQAPIDRFVSADAAAAIGVVYDGETIPQGEWQETVTVAQQFGLPHTSEAIGKLVRAFRQVRGPSATPPAPAPMPPAGGATYQTRLSVRGALTANRETFAGYLQTYAAGPVDKGEVYRAINKRLAQLAGAYVKEATLAQLQAQVRLLEDWLDGFARARKAGGKAGARAWLEDWEAYRDAD